MFEGQEARLELFENYVSQWLLSFSADSRALKGLQEAMAYSMGEGGKRTRPLLGLAVAEQLGVGPQRVLPFVCAVEVVHTYSLIHDDLPAMDNDDFRRGKPTNHKVFGEACALLAGDVLLTEAFGLVARNYPQDPHLALKSIQILSEGSGFRGMGGGQAIDLMSKREDLSMEAIFELHAMKTGALFRTVCEGVAVLCGATEKICTGFRHYGAALGLCFQLADDLLDSKEKIEAGSLPAKVGLAETRKILNAEGDKAISALSELGIRSGPLLDLIKWNQNREK